MTAHRCHVPGCPVEVPPKMLMCRRHWYSVPKAVRDRVWDTYQPGQERRLVRPSAEWMAAADAAIKAATATDARRPRLPGI